MHGPCAILAEDETVLRDELRQHLSELWPELRVVAEARTGIEALEMLERHHPDLMFLDIEMPGLTGLDVAHQVRGRCYIVFVTAYDAYAVAAFEAGAIDYILKPVECERLKLTIERTKRQLGVLQPQLDTMLRELARGASQRKYLRWINASIGQQVQLITVDEVLYFQADTKYTRVVTATAEALIRTSLQELQKELDPAVFWQIHRSTIVNANAIAGIQRDYRGRLTLELKQGHQQLSVSESHHHLFRQM